MNEEHTKELTEKYPWITPTDGYGIGVGDGWFELIDCLCGNIHEAIKFENECVERYKETGGKDWTWKPADKPHNYPEVHQIKEKFGGLRFYCATPSGTRYEIRGMLQLAESMSFRICDSCGNKGKTRDHAWRRTLCDTCEKKQNKGKRFEKLRNLK